jgi:hypothetical protein
MAYKNHRAFTLSVARKPEIHPSGCTAQQPHRSHDSAEGQIDEKPSSSFSIGAFGRDSLIYEGLQAGAPFTASLLGVRHNAGLELFLPQWYAISLV